MLLKSKSRPNVQSLGLILNRRLEFEQRKLTGKQTQTNICTEK